MAHKNGGLAIKKFNRNRIYRYLYDNGESSKQDIAQALKISLPTVTQNIKDLLQMGLIEENGTFESTGGRKARAIAIKKDARFAVGLDVTTNHLGIVAVDVKGNVIRNERIRFPFVNEPGYFREVGEIIKRFTNDCAIDSKKILGVGIAVPAIVSPDGQVLNYSPILGFTGGTLHSFSQFISFPCKLCNDANAAGSAELWNANRIKDMIYLLLNNSVGGAVLIDGSLCFGKNQRTGEFGHITIVPNGEMCYCGQKGCVDAYCNARILADSAGGKLENFFELLKQGSPSHLQIWQKYLYHLTLVINNLRMVFDCDIILGGYVGTFMDDYLATLREAVAKKNTFEYDGTYLKACQYKLEATAVGSALMFISSFLGET